MILAGVLLPSAPAQDAAPKVDLRHVILTMARKARPAFEERQVRAELDVLELELSARLATKIGGRAKAQALSDYFFKERKFSASPDLADPTNFYVNEVLATKQGYCLSLSAIILSIARRLDLPLQVVACPRHVYLRWDEGELRLAIETTQGGAFVDEDSYRSRGITPEAEAAGVFMTPLSDRSLVGYLLNNEGFILWHAGETDAAEKRFRAALGLRSELVEAMINLGVLAGERGDEAEAEEWFAKAGRWLPGDEALTWNRALTDLRA
ncbi:MAG: hypothetical protein KDB53_05960, partial [Planctomycetes bacterium]|nr:hypothetical protein [Planctomycetota bacterium]